MGFPVRAVGPCPEHCVFVGMAEGVWGGVCSPIFECNSMTGCRGIWGQTCTSGQELTLDASMSGKFWCSRPCIPRVRLVDRRWGEFGTMSLVSNFVAGFDFVAPVSDWEQPIK